MGEHPNASIVRLADDGHAVILLGSTVTVGDRCHTGEHVDVYRLRAGKSSEH